MSRERREGIKIPGHHAQDKNFNHARYFCAAAIPISLKRIAATPLHGVQQGVGQKSKLGILNVKVPISFLVDYETYPDQECICTAKLMETYLCEKLIF